MLKDFDSGVSECAPCKTLGHLRRHVNDRSLSPIPRPSSTYGNWENWNFALSLCAKFVPHVRFSSVGVGGPTDLNL